MFLLNFSISIVRCTLMLILKSIKDKIIVTEVSEDDYNSRIDQIEEIKMLEAIH